MFAPKHALYAFLALCFMASNLSYAQEETPTPTPTPSSTPTVNPLRKVGCRRIVKLGANGARVLYKYQASGHLAGTERARSCSLIYGKGNNTFPRQKYLYFYDKSGVRLGVFKNFAMFGRDYAARWYTLGSGPSCYEMAARARKRTRRYLGYISLQNGSCFEIKDIRKRQGRVK
ncbi:MAG: hypothetical protein GYA55_10805 [SAR324 cluster bacterium]|uniref:Uncharacterized protein n=1 Tax=SAR324 cluster bacterium TaxID=2024889 RepID=A0A7X9FTQ9_9DELT|nr:hypothetical protein [SAR324 cluster bacterium]